MFEHLLSPEFDDPYTAPTADLLAAQMNTASILEELGSPEHLITEDEKQTARNAFAKFANPAISVQEANAAALRMQTPGPIRHITNMLTPYDWEYVDWAKNMRGYVAAKVMEETTHPDAKIRLRALEMLGKLTEVGSFTERIQVTKVDATDSEVTERLRAKLTSLLPKTVEVETVVPRPADDA